MDIERLLQVVDTLSPDDLERLKARIDDRQEALRTQAQAWAKALDEAVEAFWGESSETEMQTIFDAMNQKSPPSEKGA